MRIDHKIIINGISNITETVEKLNMEGAEENFSNFYRLPKIFNNFSGQFKID